MKVKIYSVESVSIDSHTTADRKTINVSGFTNTGGWSGIELIEGQPAPKDLMYTLDLVGLAPSGIVSQALTRVEASFVMTVKNRIGVRVRSATNELSELFNKP